MFIFNGSPEADLQPVRMQYNGITHIARPSRSYPWYAKRSPIGPIQFVEISGGF
jgi:hypothetical protein